MDIALRALAVVVGILAILQGWQVISARRNKKNNNPGHFYALRENGHLEKLQEIANKLDRMNNTMERMEQRVNDCWAELQKKEG